MSIEQLWRRPGKWQIAAIGECMIEISEPDGLQQSFAGDTLNAAVYLARELAGSDHRIEFLTAVGEDPYSAEMLAFIKAQGVGVDLVATRADKLPGLYRIQTDEQGERSFFYWRGESAAREMMQDYSEAGLLARLAGFQLVYCSGITLAILPDDDRQSLLNVLAGLRQQGTIVAFDSNYRPGLWPDELVAAHWIGSAYRLADLLLVGLSDEQALFGDGGQQATLTRLAAYGAAEIVVKNGAAACTVQADGEQYSISPIAGINQVDSTAAGDSFNAAYMAARIEGESASEAAAKGHLLASRVVQYHGAIIPA